MFIELCRYKQVQEQEQLVQAQVLAGAGTFAITEKKRYVSVLTLPTQGNTKLQQKLKSGFKRTINWNKYQSKVSIEAQNIYIT